MISAIFIFTAALFAVGACFIAIIHRVHIIDGNRRMTDWLKYGVYVGLIYMVVLAGICGQNYLAALLIIIIVGGSVEFYRNLQHRKVNPLLPVVMLAAGMIFCFGHLMDAQSQPWYQDFIFVFLLVAVTDSFSQLMGRLLGHHRLCPAISPNKTVEGFVGGTAAAALAAVGLQFLKPDASFSSLAAVGLVIALSATAGDLLFSYIKRCLKIKDFSGLLPGHGGLLDRFDSLLVAAPVYYWTNGMLLN